MERLSRFQSLVGRLETNGVVVEFVAGYGFQSLVGRLETSGKAHRSFPL